MPPMNPTGTNTAVRMSAIAMTGPDTSSIALPIGPFGLDGGLSNIAASAGESVSALNAENSTEIPIVIANCW